MGQARLQNRREARIERALLGPAFRPKDRPWPLGPPRPGKPTGPGADPGTARRSANPRKN
eukprot:8638144-Pyramimonas_sp.AAC.1